MALNPEVKLMLDALYASDWQEPAELTPLKAREQSAWFAKMRVFPGKIPQVAAVDYAIPVADQQTILARCYYPSNQRYAHVVVFYHGGGYVLSDVNLYDTTCRWMCSVLEMPIISVDYRLAPENPFPVPIDDGYQALCWVSENFKALNLQPSQIIVAGDSAGGHLAAMVSHIARDKVGPAISWQWLIYPWVDNDATRPSYQNFATGFGLSKRSMLWFNDLYLKNNNKTFYPNYPLHFSDFSHLPPAYIIVAENDVLLDEGKIYAERLRTAGNKVYFELAEGMIHGFINHYSISAGYHTTLKMFEKMKALTRES
jgi:acetyl esterase/lipase